MLSKDLLFTTRMLKTVDLESLVIHSVATGGGGGGLVIYMSSSVCFLRSESCTVLLATQAHVYGKGVAAVLFVGEEESVGVV